MTFTTMEGENLVTLDEALAFINFCDEGIEDETVTATTKVEDYHEHFTLEDLDELLGPTVKEPVSIPPTSAITTKHKLSFNELQSAPPTIKKKRVRSSSTAQQRRKKVEIKTLREEVAQLEGYLTQLNGVGGQQLSLAVTKDDGKLSKWHRHALMQYQQRHQSELANRQLKEMIVQQLKIANKLQGVLHKRNVLDGMDFVRTLESPCFEDSHFSINYATVLMDQLEEEVDGVYRNFDRIYQPRGGPISNCITQTMYNEKCQSNAMEFATITPMDSPMRAAFKHVWDFLDNSSDRSRKPNTLETKVNMTLPLRNSTSCHFYKVHFLRKYEEQDRIIIIWSDVIQMTSKNIRLRSLAHAVFTPSEADPLNASVMQTSLKLYVDPMNGNNVAPEDIRYGREVVLGAFGRLMRKFWQEEQTRMLEVTSHSFMSV